MGEVWIFLLKGMVDIDGALSCGGGKLSKGRVSVMRKRCGKGVNLPVERGGRYR